MSTITDMIQGVPLRDRPRSLYSLFLLDVYPTLKAFGHETKLDLVFDSSYRIEYHHVPGDLYYLILSCRSMVYGSFTCVAAGDSWERLQENMQRNIFAHETRILIQEGK